jgi:hypothetical protein
MMAAPRWARLICDKRCRSGEPAKAPMRQRTRLAWRGSRDRATFCLWRLGRCEHHWAETFHSNRPPRPAMAEMVPLMASDPSDLKRLLDRPDTVTQLLENLTDELVVAKVVRQYSVMACTDNALGIAAGHAITHRISVLKGRNSEGPCLEAESMFVQVSGGGP